MKRSISVILMIVQVCLLIAIDAPIARIEPYRFEIHGFELIDNYHWLKDKSRQNEEVLQYIEAENKFTDESMKHTKGLQEDLYKEFRNRIPEEDTSVPYKLKNYWYYNRDEKGLQYPIYCRKYEDMSNKEEVYLDMNILAEGNDYLSINSLKISP